MDRLLSVSQAARMVGVPRKLLQQHIQDGRVMTFEGYIRMSELHKAYPEADGDHSGMLEKVRNIQDAARFKEIGKPQHDAERLAAELHRARIRIAGLEQQVADYQALAAETEDRLMVLQDSCDRRQAMALGTLLGWFMNQVKLRER